MGWFGKKEEKEILPELPEPEFPSLPDLPELPRSSTSPTVAYTEKPSEQDSDADFYSSGAEVSFQRLQEPPKKFDMGDFKKSDEVLKEPVKLNYKKQKDDIYIKLDKFQTTQQMFHDIKHTITDIEKLLGKIKEIKEKEDKELEQWEKETQMIKSRLEVIDSHLFDGL